MSTKKERFNFGDMTLDVIDQYEKENNAIVLLSDNRCVMFSGCDGNNNTMVILVDGLKKPIWVGTRDIIKLKDYLNKNF